MSNADRVNYLARRVREPQFRLGQLVREPHGEIGVVDKIFADLDAAFDTLHYPGQPDSWYAQQRRRPHTAKDGVWYGVLLNEGSCLVGEKDLSPFGPGA
jgi:hypothetical protein